MMQFEEKDNRFYIDRSTLPHAGYGLFAKVRIKKDEWLEVAGILVKTGSNADDCTHYAKRYKFQAAKKGFKIVPLGFAGIVNHTDDRATQNVQLTRLPDYQAEHCDGVVYQALRDIEPGEELLGYYGDQINAEIGKAVASLKYLEANQSDWAKFLSFDLYNLKCLEEVL